MAIRLFNFPSFSISKSQRRNRGLRKYRSEIQKQATFNKADALKDLVQIQVKETGAGKDLKIYSPMEAIEDIKEKQDPHKTDENINLYIRLGIDATKSDQQVRGTIVLPAGTGKETKVAIFTSDDFKHIAAKTKADMIIDLNHIKEITPDNLKFDVLVATNDVIKLLKPFGRTIGNN